MNEDRWLKQIKNRLDDYAEPLPVSGWEQLEKELSAASQPLMPKTVPFYRRWTTAAAVVLLAVSSVSVWLMLSPVSKHIQEAAVAISAESHQPLSDGSHSTDYYASSSSPSSSPSSYTYSSSSAAEEEEAEQAVLVRTSSSDEECAVYPVEEQESTTGHEADSVRVKPKARYRPSSRDKYHLPVSAEKTSSSRGWSFALAANTGSLQSLGHSSGNQLIQRTGAVLSSDGFFDLSATAQEIFYIPGGQQLEFHEGMPLLQGGRQQVVSMDHRQPVSVGVSFRKQLSKGFSLESGVQYTYLASDATLLSGEEIKQKLHYIGIPLRANWSFLQKERWELYVSAGGAVEKCVYGKVGSHDDTVKPLQFSVMGAVGAQLNISHRIGLYVEPGISYYFDDGSAIETIRKENPCNFTLQGGIRFTY